jgi:hypothetical protein
VNGSRGSRGQERSAASGRRDEVLTEEPSAVDEPPTSSTRTADKPATANSIVEWLAVVVPLATVFTGLALWFGWTLTSSRGRHFGLDNSVVQFSPTDYVLRSADALFIPVLIGLVVCLLWISAHAAVVHQVERSRWMRGIRIGTWIAVGTGLTGLVLSIPALFFGLPAELHYLTAPIALGGSAALTADAFSIARRVSTDQALRRPLNLWQRSGYVVASTLVVISVFWASTSYAGALGRGSALSIEVGLQHLPAVTVFSDRPLGLSGSVQETLSADPDAGYRFRYSGLRLLVQSAGKYFLLPEGWTRDTGVAIVLPDRPDIRLEFRPGRR